MISSLHGNVLAKTLKTAVIECAGVGYEFSATPRTLAQLVTGETATVRTHLQVRDTGMVLYGFRDAAEKDLFLLLQTVPSIGPKVALDMLATLTPDEFVGAVAAEDTALISTTPGVGKRTASRIVLELKPKIGEFAAENALGSAVGAASSDGQDAPVPSVAGEVTAALEGLGFAPDQADAAVRSAAQAWEEDGSAGRAEPTTAQLLRAALALLGKA